LKIWLPLSGIFAYLLTSLQVLSASVERATERRNSSGCDFSSGLKLCPHMHLV